MARSPMTGATCGIEDAGMRLRRLAVRVQGLDLHERMVLGAIGSHMGGDAVAFPSRALLALETGMSPDSITRATQRLVVKGLILSFAKTPSGG